MRAWDTETTGLDMYRGCKPFFVTTCTLDGAQRYWEWDVNPLTRQPQIPKADIQEIEQLLLASVTEASPLILHNSKFDVTALASIGIDRWPWELTRDTLMARHLLASNKPKDLTSLCIQYLGINIEPHEQALHEAVAKCRRLVQQARLKEKRGKEGGDLANWRIAEEGLEELPSATGKGVACCDYWLPRAMMRHLWETSEAGSYWEAHWNPLSYVSVLRHISKLVGWEYRPPELASNEDRGHPWWTVLSTYTNVDSAATIGLWPAMWEEVRRRQLEKIYAERLKLLPIAYDMERRGVTISKSRAEHLRCQFAAESVTAGNICTNVAAGLGHELVLPKGSRNDNLNSFVFDVLKLPIVRYTDKGNPAFDKACLEEYLVTLPPQSRALTFIQNLQAKRQRDTALGFLAAYETYWLPLDETINSPHAHPLPIPDWYVLHPNLNVCQTDTLRMSSSNPNAQQISKKGIDILCEDCEGAGCKACGDTGRIAFNLRHAFGPAPGREWWPMDYENIELRIPAYESGEPAMVDLFERPDDPPFYGSYHLLNASIMYPDLFMANSSKGVFKKKFSSTWYQWCKNAGFALIYGCQERKFDATAHKPGAYQLLRSKLPKLFQLSDRWIRFAEKHGYVETIPDKTVNPKRGYPLLCSRTERGRISPTVPLNYHVQSTAMWCTARAMVRCEEQLRKWRAQGFDAYITMQVHDEICFDFPAGGQANLAKATRLKELMEESGEDIGIPLTVAMTYCPCSWDKGEELEP